MVEGFDSNLRNEEESLNPLDTQNFTALRTMRRTLRTFREWMESAQVMGQDALAELNGEKKAVKGGLA